MEKSLQLHRLQQSLQLPALYVPFLYLPPRCSNSSSSISVIIFAGAMLGFCLARLQYLDINTYRTGAAPGEWYWYRAGIYRVAILMHLASVLPGGILLICQFIPLIRKKAILFHRINGYLVILLLLLGCISGLILCRRSFGGHISTQAATGMLAIIVIGSFGMALYNIKRLQIDQHRAWMLRAAFYCGVIITIRLISFLGAVIIPMMGKYYGTMSCDQLSTLVGHGAFESSYPQCFTPNGTADGQVAVLANFNDNAATVGMALQLNFGMAVSQCLHES